MNYDSRAKFEGIAVQRGEFEMFSFAFPGSRCCFAVVPAIKNSVSAHCPLRVRPDRGANSNSKDSKSLRNNSYIHNSFVAEVVIRLITADCDSLIEGSRLSVSNREATSRTFFAGYY